jgi:sigma-E factor negative regulatory protein RseA
VVEGRKADISALMDGELEAAALEDVLSALREEGEALGAWRAYHLIGDALQGRALLGNGCSTRVAARLAAEPALLGPLPANIRAPQRAKWFVPSALAASVAAVALVGWMALAPRPADQAPFDVVVAPPPAPAPKVVVVRQPLTAAARDYLIAHQAYSPRNSLQGVAPYVRSVSAEAAPGKP